MKIILLLLAFAVTTAWGEETNFASFGKLLRVRLASAPFPHDSRAQGHTYKGKAYPAAEHYSDNTVAIFVPAGFRETGQVDFVVHFHGWNNHVSRVLEHYRLIEQLAASGRNAVLVVPEGPKDSPDSSGGKLEDKDGFRHFMEDVVAELRRSGALRETNFSIGRIILSGHSGGYKVMAAILDRGGLGGPIREAWLFDALYADTDKFLAWMDRTPGARLLSIYTDQGGTRRETESLMASLKQRSTPITMVQEDGLNPADLPRSGFVFLHTALAHDEVLDKHQTFKMFLETSDLGERTAK